MSVLPQPSSTWHLAAFEPAAGYLLVAAGAAIPLTLLWDFSWESCIGIDLPWSPPHASLFVAIMLAGLFAALCLVRRATAPNARGVQLARWKAPLGVWIILWGVAAFLVAWASDRWWQTAYGLAAGLWGPPQLLKAASFFAILLGIWIQSAGTPASPVAGGCLLALISVVTLPSLYANRQHSASFFLIASGTYPLVLAAQAVVGRGRFPATMAALVYFLLWGGMVWLLPLFPAEPLVAPIVNLLDHLLPPPFPLLLFAPALAIDLLWRVLPARRLGFGAALEGGIAFLLVFATLQWKFGSFLLSPAAAGRFFAGGGEHWPFFLQIAPAAKTEFWPAPGGDLDLRSTSIAAALAMAASFAGLRIGTWLKPNPS